MEIQQREANIGSYPVPSHTHTQVQPHPQWGGQGVRPQVHTSPVAPATGYQHHGQGPQAHGMSTVAALTCVCTRYVCQSVVSVLAYAYR